MNRLFLPVLFCAILLGSIARAADHKLEELKSGPPEEVSKAIQSKLAPSGFKVIRGTSRTVCEVWLCKAWSPVADFKPTDEVLYPFKPGQLLGVIRYPRKGSDFRDQDISKGVYTLRYAQQPVDGAHVGTSPTRDFLLLVGADKDKSPDELNLEKLVEQSAEAAGSSHPAMLCLQRAPAEAEDKPTIHHQDEHDWWIVTVKGNLESAKKKLPVSVVVVGVSTEQ